MCPCVPSVPNNGLTYSSNDSLAYGSVDDMISIYIIERQSLLLYRSLYINYLYSNILSWNIIEKTRLATWGLEPASLVSVVNRHAICSYA